MQLSHLKFVKSFEGGYGDGGRCHLLDGEVDEEVGGMVAMEVGEKRNRHTKNLSIVLY